MTTWAIVSAALGAYKLNPEEEGVMGPAVKGAAVAWVGETNKE